MLNYNKVLLDNINKEIEGRDFFYRENDRIVLKKMYDDINKCCHAEIHFLAEIDALKIPQAGTIMARYLNQFQSESIRSYLIPQIVSDRVKDCARTVLSSYLHFKNSDEYISPPCKPAPAQIYTRYDNAFRTLKPKELKDDLLSLAYNPRDAFYLPFTMRMLASWKIPDLERVFTSYLDGTTITQEALGISRQSQDYYPSFSFIERELRFTAIDALRFYSSESTVKLVEKYTNDPDKDICAAAKKTLNFLIRHTGYSFLDKNGSKSHDI